MPIVDRLLGADDPSIRWKLRTKVLGESECSPDIQRLRIEIKASPRVAALLAARDETGRLTRTRHIDGKWQGAHWVLSTLADIGYPVGDTSLTPVADQLLDNWLAPKYFKDRVVESKSRESKSGVLLMQGRYRRCASQQANALWAIMALGLYTPRCDQLVERLLYWQWPDGGWNCDKNPDAATSSLEETWLGLRGLPLYEKTHADSIVLSAAGRAAEVFLCRGLFRRRESREVIRPEFTKLHYPPYWHYDILGALKVMAETGYIDDPRCGEALDLLESKRLPDGGWPAELKYYKVSEDIKGGADLVDWGGVSKRRSNDWVTADALAVLVAAGRAP